MRCEGEGYLLCVWVKEQSEQRKRKLRGRKFRCKKTGRLLCLVHEEAASEKLSLEI
jgi:hypothetical protein